MGLYAKIPMVSNRPAKFSGHKHCGNGNRMVVVYHVIFLRPPDFFTFCSIFIKPADPK